MKLGVSSLNPNAAPYFPLFKKEACDKNGASKTPREDSTSDIKTACSGLRPVSATDCQHKSKSSSDFIAQGKQIMVEESEVYLAYLQMMFPSLSNESLSDIYLANRGDLEATVDMLSQLEVNV